MVSVVGSLLVVTDVVDDSVVCAFVVVNNVVEGSVVG